MGFFQSKPAFVTVLAEQQVTRGDHVTLQCKANIEHVTATWEKDDHVLCCVEGKHHVSKDGTTCTLEISNAQERDEGKYTITLNNKSGSASCCALIRVQIKEWRQVQWSQDEMLRALKTFKVCNKVQELRFLLYGPVGAGKSSTINTIRTIFEGRQFVNCLAAAESTTSHTSCYQQFRFANEEESFPFTFNDIMGAEENEGVLTQDIISALKGHIKEGYVFNAQFPLSEGNHYYNQNPSLSDQMHCLVCVIAADRLSISQNIIQKLKTVRRTASSKGIPQVIFLTRVDLTCPLAKENLQDIYKSKKIRDKMHECSNALGVPVNCVFPVLNYNKETHMNTDINCLMLDALTHAVHWANDYVITQSNQGKQQPNSE